MKMSILKAAFQTIFIFTISVFMISGCSKTDDRLSEKPPVNKDSAGVTRDNTMTNRDTNSMNNNSGTNGEYSTDMNDEMKDAIKDVKEMKSSGDINMDYADMLIRLNEAAVDIADTEKKNGKDENMKSIAAKMSEDHAKDISKLKNWKENYKEKTGGAGTTASLMKTVQAIETKLNAYKISNNIDKDFGELMKQNHMGGMDLGQQYMKDGGDKDLKAFTKVMLEDFPKEVKDLETAIAKVK